MGLTAEALSQMVLFALWGLGCTFLFDLLRKARRQARDIAEQARKKTESDERPRQDWDRDELLLALAHALRNPLAPIRNSMHVLQLIGPKEPDFQDLRNVIERQVHQMVRLIDDLLDVSRLNQGQIELRPQKLDIATVIHNVLETSRRPLDAGQHQLTVSLPPQPLYVTGDPTRLAQALSHILDNAAKFTLDGGHIILRVEKEAQQVVIRVSDNGMGLSSEMLPRIFEMFTKVDRTQGGLGIGLTLARSLVELHQGSIEVRSPGPGQGSEFLVRLPLLVEKPKALPPEPDTEIGPTLPTPRRRILVVDDNQDSAQSLALLLEILGNEVRSVHDGPTALKVADEWVPDMVLLDIGMPGMDGYEVARRMRALPVLKRVRLVAQTGWGQEEDRQHSQDAGFDHHLVKPVEVTALQDLLASL